MAITDKITGKIIGCKKGTIQYAHERAHLIYGSSKRGITFDFWCQSCLIMTVIYLTIYAVFPVGFWKLSAVSSCLLFLFFYGYEEYWCWKYAYKHYKKPKPKGTQTMFIF